MVTRSIRPGSGRASGVTSVAVLGAVVAVDVVAVAVTEYCAPLVSPAISQLAANWPGVGAAVH